MALHLEFGHDLGSGENFRLDVYYQMMDEIVSAIRQRDSLIRKYEQFLNQFAEGCEDPNYHLLAFDFVYCCLTYHLYSGLNHLSKRDAIEKKRELDAQEEARLTKEQKRAEIQDEIDALLPVCNLSSEISLLNVQVTARGYGVGTVVSQQGTRITVRFADAEKKYEVHKKYLWLPKFESDSEILELFTKAGDAEARIRELKQQLERLQ